MAKKNVNYISARESRKIAKENRKITKEFEAKRNRKHIPEEEYVTKEDYDVAFNISKYIFAESFTGLKCEAELLSI